MPFPKSSPLSKNTPIDEDHHYTKMVAEKVKAGGSNKAYWKKMWEFHTPRLISIVSSSTRD